MSHFESGLYRRNHPSAEETRLWARMWRRSPVRHVGMLTVAETAARLGVSYRTLMHMRKAGKGPRLHYASPNRSDPAYYLEADVDAWLAEWEARAA